MTLVRSFHGAVVLVHGRDRVDVIECKRDPSAFGAAALKVFRSAYPKGRNFLVTPGAEPGYEKRWGELRVWVCTPTELVA